jgi:hypothetical protein
MLQQIPITFNQKCRRKNGYKNITIFANWLEWTPKWSNEVDDKTWKNYLEKLELVLSN